MKIKEIAPENRPMERLEKLGKDALSDAELLAIVLKSGSRGCNAVDLGNMLISSYGLEKLGSCSVKELEKIKGIGKSKACQVIALFELAKRQKASCARKQIKCAKDVFNIISPAISDSEKENFIILHLDTKNRIIKQENVSVGTLNCSIIHPREVFKSAIRESANSVIAVHNHPSGSPEPSEEDRRITKALMKAGDLLSIKVLDHVIIGKEGYFSFRENC